MESMGVIVHPTNGAKVYSSAAKGETLEDTARTIEEMGYQALVVRHGDEGSLAQMALATEMPIINAGDGPGEHPTQALLDAYTIWRQHGRLKDLTVVFGGDLKHGRTINSLATLLSKYPNNKLIFASIEELELRDETRGMLDNDGTEYEETNSVEDALSIPATDVVYWTRTQKERHLSPSKNPLTVAGRAGGIALGRVKELLGIDDSNQSGFVLNNHTIRDLSRDAIIMHPLPRVDEIAQEIDDDPRAIYFEQVRNGAHIRSALMHYIFEGSVTIT